MTPEEATERWCPMTFNREQEDTCRADGCMAWRWSWSPKQAASYAKPLDESRPKKLEPSGYCGLAGAHGN